MKTQLALVSIMLIPCLLFAMVSQADTLGLTGLADSLNSQSTAIPQDGESDSDRFSTGVYAGAEVQTALWQRSSLARVEPKTRIDELDQCCGTFQHSELGQVEIERSGSNDLAFTYGDRVILFHLVDNDKSELAAGRDFVSAGDNPYRIRFRGSSTQMEFGESNFSQLQLDVPVCETMLTFQRKPTSPSAMESGEHQPLVATPAVQ